MNQRRAIKQTTSMPRKTERKITFLLLALLVLASHEVDSSTSLGLQQISGCKANQ
jgi:hypothetical protein